MSVNIKQLFDKEEYDRDILPENGLGKELFDKISCLTPIVNVDLLIYNSEGKVLVSWRDDLTCGAGWHIPGGIIRYKESLKERAEKTALAEIGEGVEIDLNPIDINEIILPQEERGHFISVLLKCRIDEDRIKTTDGIAPNAGDLHWYNPGKDVPLVKGQRSIYSKYVEKNCEEN